MSKIPYFLIAATAIMALIATAINTDKDEKSSRKKFTFFKRPNLAGWTVIIILIISAFWQFSLQFENDRRERDKSIEDSLKNVKIVALLDTIAKQKTYSKITLIRLEKANDSIEELRRALGRILVKNNEILAGTIALLHPFKPTLAMVDLKIPFKKGSPFLKIFKRLQNSLDSINSSPKRSTVKYVRDTTSYAKTNQLGNMINVISYDWSRSDGVNSILDSFRHNLFDAGFQIVFSKAIQKYPAKPEPSIALTLVTDKLVDIPGSAVRYTDGNASKDNADSCLFIKCYFTLKELSNNKSIVGISDLKDKYLKIDSRIDRVDFSIVSICFFYNNDLGNYTTVYLTGKDEGYPNWKNPYRQIPKTAKPSTEVVRPRHTIYQHKLTALDLQ